MANCLVSDVRFQSASAADRDNGLLGWVSVVLDEKVQVDGIVVRRTASGELRVFFPERRDRAGRLHPIVRPLSISMLRSLENQVLGALWAQGELP